MKNFKKQLHNHLSTIIGYVMAIANAWLTIDWVNFDWNKEWMKLILSAALAIGGHMTSINVLRSKDNE